jgi:hypothetical protein
LCAALAQQPDQPLAGFEGTVHEINAINASLSRLVRAISTVNVRLLRPPEKLQP